MSYLSPVATPLRPSCIFTMRENRILILLEITALPQGLRPEYTLLPLILSFKGRLLPVPNSYQLASSLFFLLRVLGKGEKPNSDTAPLLFTSNYWQQLPENERKTHANLCLIFFVVFINKSDLSFLNPHRSVTPPCPCWVALPPVTLFHHVTPCVTH